MRQETDKAEFISSKRQRTQTLKQKSVLAKYFDRKKKEIDCMLSKISDDA
jgi:hypothetical protein